MEAVKLIPGGLRVDDRGALSFFADLPFSHIKRMYLVENFSLKTIRAWHGHLKEAKYIFPVHGSAIIGAVRCTKPFSKLKKNKPERFVLSSREPQTLYIPPGYANGFRMLEENTKLLFLSTSTVEQSKADDYRFAWEFWGKKIWDVENR